MATVTTIREAKKIAWAAHMAFGSDVLTGVGETQPSAIESLAGVIVSTVKALRLKGEKVPDFSVAEIWYESFLELSTHDTGNPYYRLLISNCPRL